MRRRVEVDDVEVVMDLESVVAVVVVVVVEVVEVVDRTIC